MKKAGIILIMVLTILGITGLAYFANKKDKLSSSINNTNYEIEKSATQINNIAQNKTSNITPNTTSNTNNSAETKTVVPIEKEISTFTTKIYSKDPERQNNITITCNTLNDTEVKNGETFSFTNTVGKATSSKGYQKADIFVDGEKKQGIGGGNCQVSSTLYNAVIAIPELQVTERHEHSNYVPYVPKGKDAAVAYGSYDFKFINNTGKTIKIKASSNENEVTIKILKLEQ